jgi:RNA polymerase sigma-70 factor (ECF subfamily)
VEEVGEISGARVLPWTSVPFRRSASSCTEDFRGFEQVYEECLPVVLKYMLARVRDPVLAEDLAGDVFERAVRAWPTFEHRSSPTTWVLAIAHHVVSHHWRKVRTQPVQVAEVSTEQVDVNEVTPEEQVERHDDAERVRRVMADLPIKEQELLAFRFAADLSFRDIAAVLDVREVTVRVRVHRAMRRLERMLLMVEG